MKKMLKVFIALILMYGIIISPSSAAEKLRFSYIEKSGALPLIEPVLREVYKRLGYELELFPFPAERAIRMADSGKFDGEVARLAMIQKIFKNLIMVPTPICEIKQVALSKNVSSIPDGWEGLKPYKVISMRGYKHAESKFEEYGIEHSFVSDVKQLLKILSADRQGVVGVFVLLDALTAMKELEIKDIKILEPPLEILPVYHFLHNKNELLVPEVAEKIEELKQEGFIRQLEEQVIAELRS